MYNESYFERVIFYINIRTFWVLKIPLFHADYI